VSAPAGQDETAFSRRVVSSLKWQAGAQAIGQVVTWLSTLVVIRLLSSEDYGLLAMAGVLTNFFLLIADMGVGAASVQAAELSDDDLGQLSGLAILTNVGGFLLAVPAAPLVAAYFREPALVEIIVAQSVAFLFMALYLLPQAQLVRAMDFRRKARVDSTAMILSALIAIGGALAGLGVWALVAANIGLHAARTVGYRRAAGLNVAPRFGGGASRRFLAFGLVLTADRLLFFAFSQADVVIGGRVLGPELLGVYTVAMSIAVIPLDKIVPIINQVAFAAYSRIQGEADRVRRSLVQTVRIVSFGAFPIFLGLAVVAPDLVAAVLGTKWESVVVPMQLLSLMLPMKAVASVLPPALYGTGQPMVSVVNLVISLALMLVALLLGVPYGLVGLCLAWVFAYPVIFTITTTRTARAVGASPREVFAACGFPLGAGLLMAAVTFVVAGVLPSAWPPGLRLPIEVATGVAVYSVTTWMIKRSLIDEALALLRR
jgi:O-antigen/teichoic acid export membrane protein